MSVDRFVGQTCLDPSRAIETSTITICVSRTIPSSIIAIGNASPLETIHAIPNSFEIPTGEIPISVTVVRSET